MCIKYVLLRQGFRNPRKGKIPFGGLNKIRGNFLTEKGKPPEIRNLIAENGVLGTMQKYKVNVVKSYDFVT